MSAQQAPAASGQATGPYSETAAAHIQQLSRVNQDIPGLLRKSAAIISLLTNNPIEQNEPFEDKDAYKRAVLIQTTSQALFLEINRVRQKLQQQVGQLESEKVIPAEASRFIPAADMRADQLSAEDREKQNDPEARVTNGGLGDLDIALLNARAGVKQQGGNEVLDRVEGILKELVKTEGYGDEMVVDG